MDLSFEIIEKIGIISQRDSGWSKELNIINWAGKGPKFDIREWNPSHDKMGKGVTLSEDELYEVYNLLKTYFGNTVNTGIESNTSIEGLLIKSTE